MKEQIKKNQNKKITIVLVSIIALFICVFYVKGILYETDRNLMNEEDYLLNEKNKKQEEINKLINFDSLSQEFLDNYFEEVSNLNYKDNENLLIVISKSKVENTYGASKVIEAPNNQYYLVYDSKEKKDSALEKLYKNQNILSVEENVYLKETDFSESEELLNEFENYNSWGVEKLGYDDAINTINLIYNSDSSRINNVIVAILDSGLDVEEFNKYYEGKLFGTRNVTTDGTNVADITGHGTHIAGTIAESTPSNIQILAIKTQDNNGNHSLAYSEAAVYFALNNQANVISCSIASYNYSESYQIAINTAEKEGVVFVASAGNDNTNKTHYPSDYDNAISVAAVDSNLSKWGFSNYGNGIDFAAPGYKIKSLSEKSVRSGTSMATPHVASAVAILKSFNKELSFEETMSLLKKYVIDIGDDGWDERYGYGIVNFNDVEFCSEDVSCDEYGVFQKNEIDTLQTIKIAPIVEKYVPEYNYGTITNIINAEMNLYYTDDDYYTKTLAQIFDNIEIIGYDPYNYEEQAVTIKYNDLETVLYVDNSKMIAGWEYNVLDNDSIELTKLNYTENESTTEIYTITDFPQIIHVPDKLKVYDDTLNEFIEYKVTKLGGTSLNSDYVGIFEQYFLIRKNSLERVYIPSSITVIGKDVFKTDTTGSPDQFNELTTEIGPLEIIFLGDKEINIDSDAFSLEYKLKNGTVHSSKRSKILFYIYTNTNTNSTMYNYAIDNNFGYFYLDQINVELLKEDIKTFDKINFDDLDVNVTYIGKDDYVSENIDNYKIKYNNDNDSFRAGDTSFTVSFDTKYGHHVEVEKELDKEVSPLNVNRPIVVSKQYVYNGEEQEFELKGFDESIMSISNNVGKDAGEYDVIIKLKDINNYL